jgi:periplasmic divalent cation tolerance protein
MTDVVLVFTTAPAGPQAEHIARALVEERLAACVNVSPPMTSIYRWHGGVEREHECQLVIKTTRDRVPALEQRVTVLHPYELPEFLIVTVADGSGAYIGWVKDETADPDAGRTQ